MVTKHGADPSSADSRLLCLQGMARIFSGIKAFIENSPRTKRGSGRGTTFHETLTYTCRCLPALTSPNSHPNTNGPHSRTLPCA